jgi:uncharacterized DUF497 family protein
MALHQGGEMFLELFDAEPVWATIEPLGDTAHGTRIDVDGEALLPWRENVRKHGVSFEEASEAFADDLSATVVDPDHSIDEERFLLFGKSSQEKHLVIAFTERNGRIRIISARTMTRREREAYES